MGYVLLIIFNIIILIFVYQKFVNAIRKKSESSIKKYKAEVADTVSLFNKEFDRNLTLLEDRTRTLQDKVKEAEKCTKLIVNIDKEFNFLKINSLVTEVKKELGAIVEHQRVIRDSIIKEKLHVNDKLVNAVNSLKDRDITDENKKIDIVSDLGSKQSSNKRIEYNPNGIEKIEDNKNIDFKKLLHSQDKIEKDVNYKITGLNQKENLKNQEYSLSQKAYLSASKVKSSKEDNISDLLEKTTIQNYEKTDNKEDYSFKTLIDKKISGSELFNIYDNVNEEKQPNNNNRQETKKPNISGLQEKVFALLEDGKTIDEICTALSISKGACELHYHIYKSKRIAN